MMAFDVYGRCAWITFGKIVAATNGRTEIKTFILKRSQNTIIF